ncbi:MAG TPA: hypothetical protein PK153_23095 [Leptospiraceae bacterium]|nr:hypothetical protein [Leptospiraceae bacterium]
MEFDREGKILALTDKAVNHCYSMIASNSIESFSIQELSSIQKDTSIEFEKKLYSTNGRTSVLKEKYTLGDKSISLDILIESAYPFWTQDIITKIQYEVSKQTRFWTAWSDPFQKNSGWHDPRVFLPFSNKLWEYSNLSHYTPEKGNFISIPIATIAEINTDNALSIYLSPKDKIFQLYLDTDKNGELCFIRRGNRLGGGKQVSFSLDFGFHEADWRGGLRYYTEKYPEYFDPKNTKANEMAGCGAYSGYEGEIDSEKLSKMGFRINWKLSDDFPWMGMFLPPVKSKEEKWKRSCDEPNPSGKSEYTSCEQMNEYAIQMKKFGFYVLNYFNVTEFGKNKNASEWNKEFPEEEIWKNPIQFLKRYFPNAVLDPKLRTFYGAYVMDSGEEGYRDFLIEQAKRHIEMLPDTDGICIDRLDWLRYFNPNADDGVSMHQNKITRSLVESWNTLIERLASILHEKGKVIFTNPMTMRLDLYKEVDGFYSEHGESGPGLNSLAWIGMRKTSLTWTCMWWYIPTYKLKPDPDSFFQRHLLMGVFPTAPYPFNNHALRPNAKTDQYYLDYGPMLLALRGKKWVLAPHCVVCEDPKVKVNLFETLEGYALPVTFAFHRKEVEVWIQNLPDLKTFEATVCYPAKEVKRIETIVQENKILIRVPIVRGCALIKLKKKRLQ